MKQGIETSCCDTSALKGQYSVEPSASSIISLLSWSPVTRTTLSELDLPSCLALIERLWVNFVIVFCFNPSISWTFPLLICGHSYSPPGFGRTPGSWLLVYEQISLSITGYWTLGSERTIYHLAPVVTLWLIVLDWTMLINSCYWERDLWTMLMNVCVCLRGRVPASSQFILLKPPPPRFSVECLFTNHL